MKIMLPFLMLVTAFSLKLETWLKLKQDGGVTSGFEDDTRDELDEEFDGISTSLSEGEEFTAEVPEEFQDDLELVEETEDVDDLLDSYEGTTIKDENDFYEGIEEVGEISNELDGDEYVILREVEFDHDELEASIEDANELHEESMISEAVEDLEQAMSDSEIENLTTEELEDALDAVNQLLEYMEETDIVIIFDEEYTYEDVLELEAELLDAYL